MTIRVDYSAIHDGRGAPGVSPNRLGPGVFEALDYLMNIEPVFVWVDRRPDLVASWLMRASGFQLLATTQSLLQARREPFWDTKGTILVTSRDLPFRDRLTEGQVTVERCRQLTKGLPPGGQ